MYNRLKTLFMLYLIFQATASRTAIDDITPAAFVGQLNTGYTRHEPAPEKSESENGKVRFSELQHEPRIYFAAPSGVLVARLRASHLDNPTYKISYRLRGDNIPNSDAQYFQISTDSGNLTTKRYIDRPVGSIYEVTVEAYYGKEKELLKLTIRVTEYNKFPPDFRSSNYRVHVELITQPGTTLVEVHATDRDAEPYNAEVYYAIQSRTSIIGIDRRSGEVILREKLLARYRDLQFTIIAYDGGSPFRIARTKLTLSVKIISAPRKVTVEQTGDQWAMLCWLPPPSGMPLGYQISLTTDFLQTSTTTRNVTIDELGHRGDKLCTALTDLESWSNFEARIAGWNKLEIGMSSPAIQFNTRVNRTCYNLNNSEYKCTCLAGFYGDDCSLFNPCLGSVSPCLNGGKCESNKSNEFQCTCLDGFFGISCEHYNPCSQASCKHGSKCYNVSDTEYACKCLQGYTGVECETDIDECASDPCLNGGTCIDEVDAFFCECRNGFKGETCEINIDECASNPCRNSAPCQDGEGTYICQCLAGYTGRLCESDIDECSSNPCENNGTCINNLAGYTCNCLIGFEGKNCQEEINECLSSPCQNGGTCVDSFNSFKCSCTAGFSGPTCEIDLDLCISSPCLNGATCYDKVDYALCDCLPGFKGEHCETKDQCNGETQPSSKGLFTWLNLYFGETMVHECPYGITRNNTLIQETATRTPLAPQHPRPDNFNWNENIFRERRGIRVWKADVLEKDYEYKNLVGELKEIRRALLEKRLMMSISNNGRAFAVRSCVLANNGSVVWAPITDGLCREEGFTEAEQLGHHLENLTKFPSQINKDTFLQATSQLKQIVNYALTDRKIAQTMISVLSNMLDVNGTVFSEVDTNRSVTKNIMETIDIFTKDFQLHPRSSISLTSPNLALEVISLRSSDTHKYNNGIMFSPNHENIPLKFQSPDDASSRYVWPTEPPTEISIVLPREAILKASNEQVIRVQFVSYANHKLFQSTNEFKHFDVDKTNKVLSAVISNTTVTNLTVPVVYKFPNVNSNHKYVCVYWDPESLTWMTSGVTTNQTDKWVSCESTHLTAFSVLLDPTPDANHVESLYSHHEATLTTISYVGATLSIFGLIFTILTYAMFRCLNRDRSGKILLNLCLSLLLMNIAWLMLLLKEHNYLDQNDICMGVALAIHYLVLTSLAWMLVEAINMYQLLITVFASVESRFMLKRIIGAWGIPLCIVGATISYTGINQYTSPDSKSCLFSSEDKNVFYIAYIGPACVILIVNFVVFLRVSKVLCMKRAVGKHNLKEKGGITMAQVRGAFTVMTLLGVTWVSGIFAVGKLRLIFRYIFCLSNSLQGFIIFIVRCVLYPEARSAWATLFRTGSFKKHRGLTKTMGGQSSSHSQHTTSSTQHTRVSAKSDLMDNVLWGGIRPRSQFNIQPNIRPLRAEIVRGPDPRYATSLTLPRPANLPPGPVPYIARSFSMHLSEDGCDSSKEGEDTSWKYEPRNQPALTNPLDLGYGTAEHSPESPHERHRQVDRTSETRLSVSTPDRLCGSLPKISIIARSDGEMILPDTSGSQSHTQANHSYSYSPQWENSWEKSDTSVSPMSSVTDSFSPINTPSKSPVHGFRLPLVRATSHKLLAERAHKFPYSARSEELL
ncbi:uncharacterized protein LOC111045476 isoform X2 [Nilaparvata lugens]|uniref:uncharacterized protein LOC111045476 isoform X2 n=1 Tax=Nilaparvata lugens TaxID=108931 RepID=UPI00193D3798|nr:uncharacterized protein LOC111045476 isoform X2 [Nilaparvata lugens]